MSRQRPCTVGLTGGLGSGKSTVAKELAAMGAAIIDADRVVHELYGAGQPGAAAVRELYGAAVLDAGGGVDREALGRRVLSDPEALEALNKAIHPLVRQQIEGWLTTVEEPVAVIEAALMVETGSYRAYDLLAVVWCRPEQQLDRAKARGVDDERARRLLAAQMPLLEKRDRADLVIDNTGSPEDLDREVRKAWEEIARCCHGGGGGWVRRFPG